MLGALGGAEQRLHGRVVLGVGHAGGCSPAAASSRPASEPLSPAPPEAAPLPVWMGRTSPTHPVSTNPARTGQSPGLRPRKVILRPPTIGSASDPCKRDCLAEAAFRRSTNGPRRQPRHLQTRRGTEVMRVPLLIERRRGLPFGPDVARQKIVHGVPGGLAFVQHRRHLAGDRHVDPEPIGQVARPCERSPPLRRRDRGAPARRPAPRRAPAPARPDGCATARRCR